ncbi:MAG: hypothetical protein SFW67_35555 [Myxococcaceae bacterium]|nr:hypothetical protein [Myxococcaceae bacterium]
MAPRLLDFAGLVTSPGQWARAPASLRRAWNATIEAPGVIRKRRGFEARLALSTVSAQGIWKLLSSASWGSNMLAHAGPQIAGAGTALFYGNPDNNVAWTAVPSVSLPVSAPATARMQACDGAGSVYLTSAEGPRRLESSVLSGFLRFAGMPMGLAPDTYSMQTGAPGYTILSGSPGTAIPDQQARAYRVTWHRRTPEKLELGGPPSSRLVLRNISGTSGWVTGVTKNATLRIRIPSEHGDGDDSPVVGDNYYFRLWGSLAAANPDDEMYLVYESPPLTVGQLAAGYATVTDSTPNAVLPGGPRLHTNLRDFPPADASVAQGLSQADDPPPFAKAIASWRDITWYGNTTSRRFLRETLYVVGTGGLAADDKFTVAGTDFVAKTTPTIASNQFAVVTSLATLELNVEATVRNLCEAINRANLGVYAYYTSLPGQFSGNFVLVDNTPTQAAVTCSWVIAAADVGLPTLAQTASETFTNGLYFSKVGRPDAVPPVNFLAVGPSNSTILRLTPFRDQLLVWTTAGLYRVTGSSVFDFSVEPLDLTLRLFSPELVAPCEDAVYAWCKEGIVRITEAGRDVISEPIEATLEELLRVVGRTIFETFAFVVADAFRHRVLFWYPTDTNANASGCTEYLQFDTRTQKWTQGGVNNVGGSYVDWNLRPESRSCGAVRVSDDKLILGQGAKARDDASETMLFRERATYTADDYLDAHVGDNGSSLVNAAVAASLRFQFLAEDPALAAHWQHLVLYLEGGELTWRPLSLGLAVSFTTEDVAESAGLSVVPVTNFLRVEVPSTHRRAGSLLIGIDDSNAAFMGLGLVVPRVGDVAPTVRRAGG